jgi:NAD(P)H-nitrite reductase large subunit
VPRHKIEKFIRLERPRFASQCTGCYGAGTGCGWCIPFIEKLHEQTMSGREDPSGAMSHDEYLARRKEYLRRIRMDRIAPSADVTDGELADELE